MQNNSLNHSQWHWTSKALFRFAFLYFTLYACSAPTGIPFAHYMLTYLNQLWHILIPWISEHVLVLNYEPPIMPNGSGDTTFHYVQVFSIFAISIVGCLIWTSTDHKRPNYTILFSFTKVCVRYYLAFVLLSYGFSKVFKSQFPFPHLERLLQPFGDASPMGLLWTFMGYSTSYTFFAGLGEVVAGILLCFSQTATLGALITTGIMGNVVMMNFSYDVPVKNFSSHLLLFSIFLLATESQRFINFFILNHPTKAADHSHPWLPHKLAVGKKMFKIFLIGYVCITGMSSGLDRYKRWGDARVKPLLYGLYEVETFTKNGVILPPLITDHTRWKNLIIDFPGRASLKLMTDKLERYTCDPDTVRQIITLYTRTNDHKKFKLKYAQPTPEILTLNGYFKNDSISVHLKRVDINSFRLVNRGFHWINEYPFNR